MGGEQQNWQAGRALGNAPEGGRSPAAGLKRRRRKPKGRAGGARRLARPLSIALKVTAFVAVLALIGVGLVYFLLRQGPVSLKFLVTPIEQALNHELPGLGVRIEDAVVRLTERGGFEFRLTNVQLSDESGAPVALAPQAAINLSGLALMRAKLAASRIDLIGARVLLFHGADGSLSLRFSKPDAASGPPAGANGNSPIARPPSQRTAGSRGNRGSPAGERTLPGELQRIDLARMLAEASARARRRSDASSYLKAIGLRDSTVIFDQGGRRRFWQVPELEMRLWHAEQQSIITGKAVINSDRGPWTLELRSMDSARTNSVSVRALVKGLVPSALARTLPQLAMLDALDMPVSGEANLHFDSAGGVLRADVSLDLAAGEINLPWLDGVPLKIDKGSVKMRFDGETRSVQIAPSTLKWGRSFVTIAGSVTPAAAQKGNDVWQFDIAAVDGELSGDKAGAKSFPVEHLTLAGRITPAIGRIQLGQLYVNVGGSEMAIAADAVGIGSAPRAQLEGRIGAMGLPVLKALWPPALVPQVKAFIAQKLKSGRIESGVFKLATTDAKTPGWGAAARTTMSLTLKAADLAMQAAPDAPLVSAPRALVRLEGSGLEVSIPEAAIKVPDGGAIAITGGRFTAVDLRARAPLGEIVFSAEGSLSDAARLALGPPFNLKRPGNISPDDIKGRVKGRVRARLPLASSLRLEDLEFEGKARLSGGSVKIPGSPIKVSAARIDIDATSKAVNIAGQMLLNGAVAKISRQHIFGLPLEKQPPFRLTTSLDNTDREQLGMDLGHLISGTVQVEVLVSHEGPAGLSTKVRADLTSAELTLKSLALRKPPGMRALLQFDVGKGSIYPTELQNFKLVSDNMALEGWVALDAAYKPKEFYFPEFSINIVSRLEVQGVLRKNNVWHINAKGRRFDGRDYFRALFDFGRLGEGGEKKRKNVPGINLNARIENVIGFGEESLHGLRVTLRERDDDLTFLDVKASLADGAPLIVRLKDKPGRPRVLWSETPSAGRALKLVGFYPNIRKGRATLQVNLDGRGAAEKTGLLEVRKFIILGDPVVAEVLQTVDQSASSSAPKRRRAKRIVRQKFDFDRLHVPFLVGHGQFVLRDSYIKGPLIGASLRGKVDFRTRRLNIGGTYIPLHGLNSALGKIPLLGQILTGPRGEGILGITYVIQGKLHRPQVIVNPLSLVAPGIFREIFALAPQNARIKKNRKSRKSKVKPQVR